MANEYRKLRDADLDKLAKAVFGLLPRGNLFNFNEESNLFKFIKYIADNSKGNMGYVSDKLMDELNPNTTNLLLDDWIEAAFSFDNEGECLTRDELNDLGDTEKRRILIARLLENGRVDREYIEQIINIWAGRTDIKVYEFFPSRLDIMEVNSTINESAWVFADGGKLRLGDRHTEETRTLPEWMSDYDIYGLATLGPRVWTNTEFIRLGTIPREDWQDWASEAPILSGDVEYDERTDTYRLGRDGKIGIPQAIRDRFADTERTRVFPNDIYTIEDRRVIIGCNFYATTHERDVIINDTSWRGNADNHVYAKFVPSDFVFNGTGFYEYNLSYIDGNDSGKIKSAPLNPRRHTRIRGKVEEWEGAMIYCNNNQVICGYFINGVQAFNNFVNVTGDANEDIYFGDLDDGSGNVGYTWIGGDNPNRNGPLYVRDIFVAIAKDGVGNEFRESIQPVADEFSTIERKYDNDLRIIRRVREAPYYQSEVTIGTAFYNSTYEVIDEDPVEEDVKTLDLIKCILKRILPLSIDYNTGKII